MENQVLSYLTDKSKEELILLLDGMHPHDISTSLEEFSDEQIKTLFEIISNDLFAQVLEESSEELQVKIINLISFEDTVKLFSFMSKDDITDILGNLPINIRKDLLKMMKSSDTKILHQLLGYDEYSAGGIMTTEYIALKGSITIDEALKKIKLIGPKTEVIETIFVLNNQKELIGTVDLRDILTSPDDHELSSIMDNNIIYVNPEDDQEKVASLVSAYDLKAIPVVSNKNLLLGIVTVDDIIDVIVEEHTEDILRLGGVSEEERIDSSTLSSIKRRLPWLLTNSVTAFLASLTVSAFENVITQVVALAAVMPIIAGMAGNAGTQTLSVVIRGIALDQIDLKSNWKLVFKQIRLGLINGATIGLLTGTLMFFRYNNIFLSLIIFVAMVVNLIISGLFGFLVPLFLKRIKIDPALASSIFLTTATDVIGFFVFLGLSSLFIPLLIK